MNKSKFILTFITISFGLVSLNSCKHEVLPPVNAADICFERDILPIFVSNCAMSGCHDATTGAEDYVLINYGTIINSDEGKGIVPGKPNTSEIWEVIQNGEMPPKKALTPLEKSMIKTWIADGAKNGMNCASNCDSSVFSYSKAIAPIITKQCLGCHQYPGASGGLDLSTYSQVKQIGISGALINSLQGTNGFAKMPPSGSGLSTCEINQFKKWIENGAPQD